MPESRDLELCRLRRARYLSPTSAENRWRCSCGVQLYNYAGFIPFRAKQPANREGTSPASGAGDDMLSLLTACDRRSASGLVRQGSTGGCSRSQSAMIFVFRRLVPGGNAGRDSCAACRRTTRRWLSGFPSATPISPHRWEPPSRGFARSIGVKRTMSVIAASRQSRQRSFPCA